MTDKFEDIADRTSRDAAAVDCSAADYRGGLRLIIERLEVDIAASEETSGGDG
jgi:hypothetical protein